MDGSMNTRLHYVIPAREEGLDPSMAGLPRYEVYAQMLEVDLLEVSIRSRYERPRQPRGFITVMAHVICGGVGGIRRPGPKTGQGHLRVPTRKAILGEVVEARCLTARSCGALFFHLHGSFRDSLKALGIGSQESAFGTERRFRHLWDNTGSASFPEAVREAPKWRVASGQYRSTSSSGPSSAPRTMNSRRCCRPRRSPNTAG